MKTLSDIASTLIQIELPCEDCDGTGQQERVATNVRNFFAPFEYIEQTCRTCNGDKVRLVDVCPLCRQDESICARACKRTLCCNRHPVDCACRNGVVLYQQRYGLPTNALIFAA